MGPMAASGGGTERVTVLTFELEDDLYCVNADSVASVVGVADDHALDSTADPWNAGTVSVDGTRIQVVDLPRAFTSAARTTERVEDPKLLIFRPTEDEDQYGWLVDAVAVTQTVQPDDLEPTRMGNQLAHVMGRVEIDGETVIWLDEQAIHG